MRRTLLAAMLVGCHPAPAVRVAAPTPSLPVAAEPASPLPASPRPTFVASASQPTALLPLGDELITTDMARRSFLRVSMRGAGEPVEVRGAGHYPSRLLADGNDAWIEASPGADLVMHVTAAGMHTPIVSQQPVMSIARDATHLYLLSANAPNLRRVPRVDAQGRAVSPDSARELVEPVVNVSGALDLAAIDGDVYVATTTSVVHVRAGTPPRRLASLPARPSVIAVDDRDVFVGAEDGAVLRVARSGGAIVELGRIEGRVASLRVDGCLVYAGGAGSVVAFERARGVRIPIASGVAATAVTTASGRVFFTDYERAAVLSMPIPACPSDDVAGGAREVFAQAAAAVERAATDDDPLAGRWTGGEHTAVVRFGATADPVARESASRMVTRVVASRGSELWARVSDAQLRALQEQGYDVALRDGVDRLRCVDVRHSAALARRGPPAPWRAPVRPRAFLVQLGASSSAFEDLAEALSAVGATLVDLVEPATLLVDASPTSASRLRAGISGVTFVTPYDARERLVSVGPGDARGEAATGPCAPTPDARLRALAAWIAAEPGAMIDLSLSLFRPSPAVERVVRSMGGAVREGRGTETVSVRVPRRALIALGDADDVRSIEASSEASPDAL